MTEQSFESNQNGAQRPVAGENVLDPIQRGFFRQSGAALKLAGTAAFIYGILALPAAALCIIAESLMGAVLIAAPGFVALVFGTWMRTAGDSLNTVALREDGPVASIMVAISDMRRIFRLHTVLFFLASAGIVIGAAAFVIHNRMP